MLSVACFYKEKVECLLEIMLVFSVEVYSREKYRNNVFIDSPRMHTVDALCSLGLHNYFERSFLFCVIKEEFLALPGYSTIWPCRLQAPGDMCQLVVGFWRAFWSLLSYPTGLRRVWPTCHIPAVGLFVFNLNLV